MWGYGAFLCPLFLLIIKVPCFENAEGEKKPRARELQGYRNWCHGLWNEFSFQHLFRMNCSHTIWAKKPTEIVMPDQIIYLLQNLSWILLFLSGADMLEMGWGWGWGERGKCSSDSAIIFMNRNIFLFPWIKYLILAISKRCMSKVNSCHE